MSDFHPSWSGQVRGLLERAIERHGGWGTWQRLRSIVLSPRLLSGMLPTVKGYGRTFTLPTRVLVRPRELEAEFMDYPAPGSRGLFVRGEVRLVDSHGATMVQATDHRTTFRGLHKYRRWSPLDALYFFGYALTHYHSLPFTLGEGRCLGLHRARAGDEVLEGVEVELPPSLHTHSQRQTFYFDGSGVLRRHDYVAEIIGVWARGAHYWQDYEVVNGVLVARRRHVVARAFGQTVPLVALHAEFDSVEVNLGSANPDQPRPLD